MADEHQNTPDDLLDGAVKSLRDTAVPTVPADLVHRTLAALSPHKVRSPERQTALMKRILKMAAALLIICGLGWLVLQGSGPGSLALADVIAEVRNARSVGFTITISGGEVEVPPTNVLMLDDGRHRIESEQSISILDLRQKKSLMLMPTLKRADLTVFEGLPEPPMGGNPVLALQQMAELEAKPLGRKQVDGVTLEGFQADAGTGQMVAWVDVQTRRPVQMQVAMNDGMAATFSDFTWDTEVDESLFSLTPPEGYEISTKTFTLPGEKDALVSPTAPAPAPLPSREEQLIASARSIERTLRAQIELYKLQHGERVPDFQKHQWDQLTSRTTATGEIDLNGEYGPYLARVPVNPIRGTSGVIVYTGPLPRIDDREAGFVYSSESSIRALDGAGIPLE